MAELSRLFWSAIAEGRAVTAMVTAVPSGPTALSVWYPWIVPPWPQEVPPQDNDLPIRPSPYTVPGPRYELASTDPFFISSMLDWVSSLPSKTAWKKVLSSLGVETIAPAAHPQTGSISVISSSLPSALRWYP